MGNILIIEAMSICPSNSFFDITSKIFSSNSNIFFRRRRNISSTGLHNRHRLLTIGNKNIEEFLYCHESTAHSNGQFPVFQSDIEFLASYLVLSSSNLQKLHWNLFGVEVFLKANINFIDGFLIFWQRLSLRRKGNLCLYSI